MENSSTLFPIPTRYIFWVGIGACLTGIFVNVQFYSGLGSGLSAFILGIEGLLLDIAKIISVALFAFLYAHKEKWYKQAYLCLAAWIVLSCFSLLANYGFLSYMVERFESKRAVESIQHQQSVDELAAAKEKVSDTFTLLDEETLKARLKTLDSQLIAEQATLAQCRPNYYTNCINPAKANIKAIQDSIHSNATQLSQVISHKEALAQLDIAKAGFAEQAILGTPHPLYTNLSNLSGLPATIIKSIMLLCLAVTAELLSGLMFYLYFFIWADVFTTKVNDIPIVDPCPVTPVASEPVAVYTKLSDDKKSLAVSAKERKGTGTVQVSAHTRTK